MHSIMKILWPSVTNTQLKYSMLHKSSIRVCQTEMAITIPSSLNKKKIEQFDWLISKLILLLPNQNA